MKTTSHMEDDLSYGRLPLPWKMTSPMEDDLSYGRRPLLWKKTSPMEDDLSYRSQPPKIIFWAEGHQHSAVARRRPL